MMSKGFATRVMLVVGLLFGVVFGSPVLAEDDAGEWAFLAEPGGAGGTDPGSVPSVEATFAQVPLYFIENQGQVDEQVAYYVQGKDKTLYFTSEGVTFVLGGEDTAGWVLKLEFLGANRNVQPLGQDATGAVISYFKGRPEEWKTGLKTYSKVVYPDLWPGIDLQYMGTVNQLKYQFVVRPGADPAQIRLAYRGADVSINEAGQLEVATPAGGFRDGIPYAYQVIDGEKDEVAVSYQLTGSSKLLQAPGDLSEALGDRLVYSFHVADYDRTRVLVLDPAVLVYCGYIGGAAADWAVDIAVDGDGNAYVTGDSRSWQSSFPVTAGPDLTHNGTYDVVVAKVSADGMGLVYCGYIGGNGFDFGYGIDVDGDGNAYVTGETDSGNDQGFPVSVGPDLIYNGREDAFVAKVSSDGTMLEYCGYIGGIRDERSVDIAVDADGNAYVTGQTESNQTTFPVKGGPDLSFNGSGGWRGDAFVAKVVSDGSGLDYCGYIGGSGDDYGTGIAVDDSGSAYIVGATECDEATFPVSVGPDTTHNGSFDTFVAKVMADGAGLEYCGYIGGENGEVLNGVAVDSEGSAYVVGSTGSSEALGFPVLVGPDLTYNGTGDYGGDAFVARVVSDGTALVYCGYIGGADDDWGHGIDLDSEGYPHVAGQTGSSAAQGFPVTSGPDQTHNGGWDAYVAKVSASGTELLYCGYVGGSGTEDRTGIAVDAEGSAYLAGSTVSGEATFPVTVGPDLDYNGGNRDAFVAKVGWDYRPTLGAITPSSGGGPAGVTRYFNTTWRDADGWEDLKRCYFHIGASSSLAGNVTLMYDVRNNKLWMRSDDGTTWLGGHAPWSNSTIENRQAKVYCLLTRDEGSGDTLSVRWAIKFKADFRGVKKTGLKCTDLYNARAKGAWIGTWNIY
jgi:hypothetical protein